MVSFTPLGRMGNFLFEAATAFAYAKKHNLPFSIPYYTNDGFWCPIYLQHLQHPDYKESGNYQLIPERTHAYQELPFSEEWRDRDIKLTGYFQSEKYFVEYRKEILEAFNFKWEPELRTVSIHVRRGDYVTYWEKHPKVSDEFYQKAIGYFRDRALFTFKIFSDDIPWCKQYFISEKFGGVEFIFSEGQTIEEDMRLGSCCLHHINSSSTYSWWMAWLNRNANKIVITPELWFTPGHGGLDTSDIIPSSWIKI